MKILSPNKDGWLCGYWTNDNIAIYMHNNIHELYGNEKLHKHIDFSEYYIILAGSMTILIDDKIYRFVEGESFRIDIGEIHRVVELDQELGCRYLVIKEKTYEGGTMSINVN